MFKTRYYTECSFRFSTYSSVIYSFSIYYCLIILLLGSCQNSVNEDKGEQLVESIISDIQLIKSNYLNCLSNIEIGTEVENICKDEVVKIRLLHKKTKGRLSVLASLKKKGILSNESYDSCIERINEELEDVRDLNHQLKEKGISINLK
ncbi:MAG: hypothetical protein MI974_32495 [Chitinophagales bacterium]|nr:hypothetical protein [Chitinophagales bacterium]